MKQIRFIDLERHHLKYREVIDDAIAGAVSEFQFVKGKKVEQFERAFATAVGVDHVISSGNGTDALFACLKAIGLKAGDEVITPAFSWISSAETISLCHARPVFADVDPAYYTIDPGSVERKITSRTKAIIAVHLFGQACEMDELIRLCKQHNLTLIEDCAQAHLTGYKGKIVGGFGTASAFSFYPTKNLGAYGDAGCVATGNHSLVETVRRYLNHGALIKDDHLFEGVNSRMDTIQASVLLAKLPMLKEWNNRRRDIAERYKSRLEGISEVKLPEVRKDTDHTWHLFVIQVQRREALQAFMLRKGVQTIIHYPRALPFTPAYEQLKHVENDFPASSQLQKTALSLPLYPELSDSEVDYVADCIREFFPA